MVRVYSTEVENPGFNLSNLIIDLKLIVGLHVKHNSFDKKISETLLLTNLMFASLSTLAEPHFPTLLDLYHDMSVDFWHFTVIGDASK